MSELAGSLKIEREQLGNGLVVLANERSSAELIAIRGSFAAGPVFDPEGKAGLSSFVSAMMMRGTGRRRYQRIIDETESIGAGVRFYPGEDVVWVEARSTPNSLEKTLEILFDCITDPVFPRDEIEKVRGTMLTRILQREDDPPAVASRLAREMLFPPGHPYHSDPIGSEESVKGIERSDLLSFWEEHYGPESMVLSFSGSFDTEDIVRRTSSLTGSWERRGGRPDTPDGSNPNPPTPRRTVRSMMHKSQADIVVACQTFPRGHPDHYALSQANAILGSLGLMGRLGKTIRENQGLAYYALSSYSPRLTGGYWMAYAGTNPANVDRALESICDEMARISGKLVTKREIGDVRTNRVGSLALRLETCTAAAGFMHELEIHDLGLDFVDRYEAIMRSVTREDMLRVCGNYLRPDACATAIAGPYEAPE